MKQQKATPREIIQAQEIKTLRDRVVKLSECRSDADRRANYFWHLYLDGLAQQNKLEIKQEQNEKNFMAAELDLGLALDRVVNAALLMYRAYNGQEFTYEEYAEAERAILHTWEDYQNEGEDITQDEIELPRGMDLPF